MTLPLKKEKFYNNMRASYDFKQATTAGFYAEGWNCKKSFLG